jgi:hypothetical protein
MHPLFKIFVPIFVSVLYGCSVVSHFSDYSFAEEGGRSANSAKGGKGGTQKGSGGDQNTEQTDESGGTDDGGKMAGEGGASGGSGGKTGSGGAQGGKGGAGTGAGGSGTTGGGGTGGCTSSEVTEQSCGDGIDNDCNGMTDCADSSHCETASCGLHGLKCKNGACQCPDGTVELPNDGIDNNCDGLIDIPSIINAFPHRNGSAPGSDVEITFSTPTLANWSLQCRTANVASIEALSFQACDGASGTSLVVKPFTAAQSQNAANNGAWATEARFVYASGEKSEIVRWTYYLHNSMHGAVKCPALATDEAYFTKAAERLASPDAGVFVPGPKAHLKNPFIVVEYDPPLGAKFNLSGEPVSVEMLSLRRRFSLSADHKYLLITRVYESLRNRQWNGASTCFAASLKTHEGPGHLPDGGLSPLFSISHGYSCPAVVLNHAGAGVCLKSTSGVVDFVKDFANQYTNALGWNKANKFMWRQLLDTKNVFSPKSYTAETYPIFLPDRGIYFQ